MENWYALRTVPGKEEAAAELLRQTVYLARWAVCSVVKKKKLSRAVGNDSVSNPPSSGSDLAE